MIKKTLLASVTALAVAGTIAAAAPAVAGTIYTSQAAYDAAITGNTQGIFDFPSGQQISLSTYNVDGANFNDTNNDLFGAGPFAFQNGNYSLLFTEAFNELLTVSFAATSDVSISFTAGYSGSSHDVSLAAYDGSTLVYSSTVANVGGITEPSFVGLDGFGPITSIDLRSLGNEGWIQVASFELGGSAAPVPEPASLLIICAGLLALGILRHRRV